MKCPNCGFVNPDQSKFCASCGFSLSMSEPEPAQNSASVPETGVPGGSERGPGAYLPPAPPIPPAEPTRPTQPTQPMQPMQPMQPVQPMQPGAEFPSPYGQPAKAPKSKKKLILGITLPLLAAAVLLLGFLFIPLFEPMRESLFDGGGDYEETDDGNEDSGRAFLKPETDKNKYSGSWKGQVKLSFSPESTAKSSLLSGLAGKTSDVELKIAKNKAELLFEQAVIPLDVDTDDQFMNLDGKINKLEKLRIRIPMSQHENERKPDFMEAEIIYNVDGDERNFDLNLERETDELPELKGELLLAYPDVTPAQTQAETEETAAEETTAAETTAAETTAAESTTEESTEAETTPSETAPSESSPAETAPSETAAEESTAQTSKEKETAPAETTAKETSQVPEDTSHKSTATEETTASASAESKPSSAETSAEASAESSETEDEDELYRNTFAVGKDDSYGWPLKDYLTDGYWVCEPYTDRELLLTNVFRYETDGTLYVEVWQAEDASSPISNFYKKDKSGWNLLREVKGSYELAPTDNYLTNYYDGREYMVGVTRMGEDHMGLSEIYAVGPSLFMTRVMEREPLNEVEPSTLEQLLAYSDSGNLSAYMLNRNLNCTDHQVYAVHPSSKDERFAKLGEFLQTNVRANFIPDEGLDPAYPENLWIELYVEDPVEPYTMNLQGIYDEDSGVFRARNTIELPPVLVSDNYSGNQKLTADVYMEFRSVTFMDYEAEREVQQILGFYYLMADNEFKDKDGVSGRDAFTICGRLKASAFMD